MKFSFIKKIIRSIKNIFKGNKMGYKFPLFKVAEIEKDIDKNINSTTNQA